MEEKKGKPNSLANLVEKFKLLDEQRKKTLIIIMAILRNLAWTAGGLSNIIQAKACR